MMFYGENGNWLAIDLVAMLTGTLFPLAITGANTASGKGDFDGRTFSKLSSKEKDILREYHENYVRLKTFYENITIEAREEILGPPRSPDQASSPPSGTDLALESVRDFTFRANGGDYYRMDGTRYDVTDLAKITRSIIGIITPADDYLLEKNLSTEKYFVVGSAKNKSKSLDEMSTYVFHIAPFSHTAVSMEHFLFEDRAHCWIDKVEEQQDSGENLVVITALYNHDKNRSRSVARFYRDRSWALKDIHNEGMSSSDDHTSCLSQTCSYLGVKDGVPLLKKCIIEHSTIDRSSRKSEISRRQLFEIQKIVPGPADLSYFDVDALLGRTRVGNQMIFSRFRIISILLGFILVLAGILIRWRIGRARSEHRK